MSSTVRISSYLLQAPTSRLPMEQLGAVLTKNLFSKVGCFYLKSDQVELKPSVTSFPQLGLEKALLICILSRFSLSNALFVCGHEAWKFCNTVRAQPADLTP